MLQHLSLNKKLIFGFLVAGLIPAFSISYVVVDKVSDALTEEARNKLVSVREGKGFQLEEMYKLMGGQVSALSQNKVVIEASEKFNTAFTEYQNETSVELSKAKDRLERFYTYQFGRKYEETNIGKSFSRLEDTFSNLSESKILLQDAFISNNQSDLGEKDKLSNIENGTSYGKIHNEFHETFRTYLKEFGFYDIFIADSETGNVIYSVYKELDFATSLKDGPYANTGIGEAFRNAMSKSQKGEVSFTDIAKYYPSYDAPAQFISAPIFKGDQKVAVLIFQVPVEKIDMILTGKKEWRKQGQGASGETYIIDKNKVMKSISRFIVEDEKGFYETMNKVGMNEETINYMKSHGTSAIAAEINTLGAENVISGKTGFEIFPDYRDINVLSAYRPLSIKGLSWYILSEMDEDEALNSLYSVQKIMALLIGGSIVIIFFVALGLSKNVSQSLVALSENLKDEADRVFYSADSMSKSSVDLAAATEEQAVSLKETSVSADEILLMVERNSKEVGSAAKLAAKSQEKASQGKEYVSSVMVKIEEIHKNNENLAKIVEENNMEIANITKIIDDISEKTKVINDIVFQTKLLSFNASVEAARAGEHGKGFSVVAEEVGALAQMSGQAAAEISTLLDKSITQVHQVVENSKTKMKTIIDSGNKSVDESLREIGTCDIVLTEILENFKKVDQFINKIASSSLEQSSGVKEITMAVQQLDEATQQNTAIAHDSSLKADELKSQSNNLSDIVENIQSLVFGTVEKVKVEQTPAINIAPIKLVKEKVTTIKRDAKISNESPENEPSATILPISRDTFSTLDTLKFKDSDFEDLG